MRAPRLLGAADVAAVHAVINEAALAYKGIIPADCWHEPYMSEGALGAELAAGVAFWGLDDDAGLSGVMGLQPVRDVALIRHAYARPAAQRRGVGSALLLHLRERATAPLLVGTWAAAQWAIRFYEKHGFRRVEPAEKDRLLATYWSVTPRQAATSVVLRE